MWARKIAGWKCKMLILQWLANVNVILTYRLLDEMLLHLKNVWKSDHRLLGFFFWIISYSSDIRVKLGLWKVKMVLVKMRDNPGVRTSKSLLGWAEAKAKSCPPAAIITFSRGKDRLLPLSQLHAANIRPRRNWIAAQFCNVHCRSCASMDAALSEK